MTFEKLIEVIKDRKKQADKNDIQSPKNSYKFKNKRVSR